ncbi:hypothetical protein EDD11_000785 [Mortierella claussenii]|nr:hypothetical protein EDD11_000785 [Mortierella claussenii]
MTQFQRSLSGVSDDNAEGVVSIATGSLGGKIKLNPVVPGPRRSLLSDMLNNQNQSSRLEQNANRRRMLKSMRRYSVDASEMSFNVLGLYPSGRASLMKGISSEGEENAAAGGVTNGTRTTQEFRDTPTVRYLRNPCQATVKTKLIQGGVRRGAGEDSEAPDYFGAEDRVCNARLIREKLEDFGFSCRELYIDTDPTEKTQLIQEFRGGEIRVMITTDVPGSTLSVAQLCLYIYYEIPERIQDYMDRSGPASRFGLRGAVVCFVVEGEEIQRMRQIEQTYGIEIPKLPMNAADLI